MRVMVSLEDRFFRTRNGNVYSNTTCDYNFWSRYLQIFDQVLVLARVCDLDEESLNKPIASGPNVCFIEVPYYVGPFGYLKKYFKLNKVVIESIGKADCFVLRIPGTISTRLWHCLEKNEKPYGVEVIGDSLESVNNAVSNKLLQFLLRQAYPANQRKQCRNASAAAYVSEFYLQEKYPPGCWSTNYSTIDLPDKAIITDSKLEDKKSSLKDAAESKRPLRICHAGTMEVAYKAQDILLEAVSICISKNIDVELTLLGEGRLFDLYIDKAKKLGIEKHVNFLGALSAGDPVRQQLDTADIFVLPSTTEGLPRILIEAMARGLPCIATNVGGIPELLDKADMVPPSDSNALASKILSVARDFKRMENMSRRNLEIAKRYSADELNRRRVEFYSKLAEETRSTSTTCADSLSNMEI